MVGCVPPELRDPCFEAYFDEGDGEREGGGSEGTRDRGKAWVGREGFCQEVNTISKGVATVARDPVEEELYPHGGEFPNEVMNKENGVSIGVIVGKRG